MPRAHTPISVVIPTFNARHLLELHLPQVAAVLRSGDEIVIVDDASTDDTANWVRTAAPQFEQKGITLTLEQHQTNQRFSAAVNSGVAAAQHPYVFLLNNDVSPLSKNIVQILLDKFNDPTMFAVGCAEVKNKGLGETKSGRGTGNFERGLLVHWFDPNQSITKTLWAAGGSMMLDRAKFLEIGGMDTLFYPAYEEDRDLSYRALKHGWKVQFEPEAVVLHQHETTNASIFGQRKMEIDSWKNQFLIVWKNITDPLLIAQHIFWLPYHLIITTQRTRGATLLGFLRAASQFSQALKQRSTAKKLWQKTDRQVLRESGSRRPDMAR